MMPRDAHKQVHTLINEKQIKAALIASEFPEWSSSFAAALGQGSRPKSRHPVRTIHKSAYLQRIGQS